MTENMTEQKRATVFRQMTDDELHVSTVKTAEKQREITLELLNHLNEVERRRLYSKFNCSSLHDYCVNELKMTSGNACHHMNAARLLKQVPEAKEKVLSGAIAVTTIAQAEAFFRREARSGHRFDLDEKKEILGKLESKSTREADKILIANSTQPEIHLKERLTQKTESLTEVRLHLDEETMQLLNRLKEIWSHAMPFANYGDLIKRAAKEAVEKNDPLKKAERSEARMVKETQTPAPGSELVKLTPMPASTKARVRRHVWMRDRSQCTYLDPRTGTRCTAKHFIEEDHVMPKAMGGEYTIDNIRLRCRAHNQRHAIDCYGEEKMQTYLN